jgi:tRNA(adenine34) deaminase
LPPAGGGAQDARVAEALSAHERSMDLALMEARRCIAWGDVPVGAVVVAGGEVVGAAGNERERTQDPTAHAEIVAIRRAAATLGSWRLDGCTVYVTLEPCAMCAGAMVLARLDTLVFGAEDPKAGFAGSLGDLTTDPRLNHRLHVVRGVRGGESAALLRAFFAERRGMGPGGEGSALP